MEISLDVLTESAFQADFEEDDIRPFTYGGRWGVKKAFGIVGDIRQYGNFLLQVREHPWGGIDFAQALAEHTVTDNMGLDTIFYFPGIKPLIEDDDENDQ